MLVSFIFFLIYTKGIDSLLVMLQNKIFIAMDSAPETLYPAKTFLINRKLAIRILLKLYPKTSN